MTRRINGDALENRDGTAVTGDVFVFDDAHVDGGEWEAPGAGSASAAWPVGSIFLSAVSTNPATLLGFGTWSAIGAGRVLIGIDAGDADFDTLGETGGSKTTAHSHGAGTYQGNYEPDHSHGIGTLATVAESAHTHAVGTLANSAESSHTHAAGTLATSAHSGTAVSAHSGTDVASHGDHTHYINFAGSDATISAHSGTAVASHPDHIHRTDTFPLHTHDILNTKMAHTHSIAAGQGSHQHSVPVNTADGSGTMADRATTSGSATINTGLATLPAMTASSGGPATTTTEQSGYSPAPSNGARDTSDTGALTLSHSVTQPNNHTLGGKTDGAVTGALTHTVTQPSNHTVTQPSAHTMSGATAAGSSHSHTMSGATAAGSSHSHAMSGAPAAGGGHGHVVSGTSASAAPSVVQPYLVVAMWQRTA